MLAPAVSKSFACRSRSRPASSRRVLQPVFVACETASRTDLAWPERRSREACSSACPDFLQAGQCRGALAGQRRDRLFAALVGDAAKLLLCLLAQLRLSAGELLRRRSREAPSPARAKRIGSRSQLLPGPTPRLPPARRDGTAIARRA